MLLGFLNKRFYLFLERREGREKERERNIDVWENIDAHPQPGIGRQPRHVPWLGIKPVTFRFGPSIHRATPATAASTYF